MAPVKVGATSPHLQVSHILNSTTEVLIPLITIPSSLKIVNCPPFLHSTLYGYLLLNRIN